jgi:hypothetical protein
MTYTVSVWEIELSDQASEWLLSLDQEDRAAIAGSIDLLEQLGPNLGRPAVDSVKFSKHHNMKEFRSVGGNLRALFCFDPRRTAIVLLGGDKTNDWVGWYDRNIPLADEWYDEYLDEIQKEGLI